MNIVIHVIDYETQARKRCKITPFECSLCDKVFMILMKMGQSQCNIDTYWRIKLTVILNVMRPYLPPSSRKGIS